MVLGLWAVLVVRPWGWGLVLRGCSGGLGEGGDFVGFGRGLFVLWLGPWFCGCEVSGLWSVLACSQESSRAWFVADGLVALGGFVF